MHISPEGPLHGLVLTGGRSERMGKDKALIPYHGQPHALHTLALLEKFCDETFLSAREGQWSGTALAGAPTVFDLPSMPGPIGGILAAFALAPRARWLIVACDLPFLGEETVARLVRESRGDWPVTCYASDREGFPEPLCALYSPRARPFLEAAAAAGLGPARAIAEAGANVLARPRGLELANVNTPLDWQALTCGAPALGSGGTGA